MCVNDTDPGGCRGLYQAERRDSRARRGLCRGEWRLLEPQLIGEPGDSDYSIIALDNTAARELPLTHDTNAVDAWIGPRLSVVEGVRASVDEIEQSGSGWTFAKLTIANATLRDLASAAG